MYPVQVSSTSERYRHDIAIGDKFHLTADEPLEVGGNDKGPTPLDFVMAGLGSCKAITIKMYAERKGWELTEVKVDVTSKKVNNQYQIFASVYVEGNLTESQKQRLLEIANKCPVHKLIASEVEIETTLVITER